MVILANEKEKKKSNITAEKRPLCSMTFFLGSGTSRAWFSHSLNVAAALQLGVIHGSPAEQRCAGSGAHRSVLVRGSSASLALLGALWEGADWFTVSGSPELETWARQNAWSTVLRPGVERTDSWRVTSGRWQMGDQVPPLIPERSSPSAVTEITRAEGRLPVSQASRNKH